MGDAYSGVTQRLVRDGVPAVIAMRMAISDEAGIALAASFYGALADGAGVDTALAERARRSSRAAFRPSGARPSLHAPSTGDLWQHEQAPTASLWKRAALVTGLVVALAALGLLIYSLIGPTRMDPKSTMNVAVTEVGVYRRAGQDAVLGGRRADSIVDRWRAGGRQPTNQAEAGCSSGTTVSLGPGKPEAGLLAGKTPDERAQAAETLADRIGADVVIYGHLEPAGDALQFVQEFYVSPRLRPEANETIGRYQLGAPIPVPPTWPRPTVWPRRPLPPRSATGLRRSSGSCWRCATTCWGVTSRP